MREDNGGEGKAVKEGSQALGGQLKRKLHTTVTAGSDDVGV